ncbi:hypothetical protein AVEN_210662-1 [Araneus ventricosus]|uniref:Uncharacterized protein n=1 Tax=Araneus ventricosus TaxID=182803 RepID=A0A4Y2ULU1_ARAVE|nr:hypothetical protein AVEN_210662-1 [Araneus ventricosus]
MANRAANCSTRELGGGQVELPQSTTVATTSYLLTPLSPRGRRPGTKPPIGHPGTAPQAAQQFPYGRGFQPLFPREPLDKYLHFHVSPTGIYCLSHEPSVYVKKVLSIMLRAWVSLRVK